MLLRGVVGEFVGFVELTCLCVQLITFRLSPGFIDKGF